MPSRRLLVTAIAASASAACAIILVTAGHGSWQKLWSMREPKARPMPPAPYQFKSLQCSSDDAIAHFMAGARLYDPPDPADAPHSTFPDNLWDMDPQAAALAFANANRTPKHRKAFLLSVDKDQTIHPPDAGWISFDSGSPSCYSYSHSLTVLRFGVDQPFIFHAATQINDAVWYNPYADRAGHALQLIPLSGEEARFLAHTLFWLEHLRSRPNIQNYYTSGISSSADDSGTLTWRIGHQAPQHVWTKLWATGSLASRWSAEYDRETGLNLVNHLLTEALPQHLGKRWNAGPALAGGLGRLSLTERLKSRVDGATRDQLTDVILTSMDRHRRDPWPADALVSLAHCAGETCLTNSLAALEELAAKLPPPSPDETELRDFEIKFNRIYSAPEDPQERKSWELYQTLRDRLEDDFAAQLRPPLTRAIRQLRALDHPAKLAEMAQIREDDAIWALQQLQFLQPDAYAGALSARFRGADERDRRMIFTTLAAAYPPGARRLRDGLTKEDRDGLVIELVEFEMTDDPELAKSRIPTLLDCFQDSSSRFDHYVRSSIIELLTQLPLDAVQQARFEQMLLEELKTPRRGEFGSSVLSYVYSAIVSLSDPDRHWDALVESAQTAAYRNEYDSLLDELATLAVANPEPRLAQLAAFLRPGITHHKGMMKHLFLAALALDLRGLAPDLARLATSGPEVAEGVDATSWGYIDTSSGDERYHDARHVIALWLEPDTDTRARMWVGLLQAFPYDFTGHTTIASCLRDRCRAALVAASPETRQRLTANARSAAKTIPDLTDWLASLP